MPQIVTSDLSYQRFVRKQKIEQYRPTRWMHGLRNLQNIKSINTKMSNVLYKRYLLPNNHRASLLAPKKIPATSPRPSLLCVCTCTNTTHPYMAVPYTHTGQLCTHVQTLTGHTGVEIMPPKCLSICENIMWSWKKDMITWVEVGEHPVFPPCGQSAAESLPFRQSLVQLWEHKTENGNSTSYHDVKAMSHQVCTDYRKFTFSFTFLKY